MLKTDFEYGKRLTRPQVPIGNPTRLYHSSETDEILKQTGMHTVNKYGKFDGTPASDNEIQMLVYSIKD